MLVDGLDQVKIVVDDTEYLNYTVTASCHAKRAMILYVTEHNIVDFVVVRSHKSTSVQLPPQQAIITVSKIQEPK